MCLDDWKNQKDSLQFIHHFIQKFYCSAKTILWREGFVAIVYLAFADKNIKTKIALAVL